MLNQSELSQLRRFVRSSVQAQTIMKKGGLMLMEVLDHYEQTIQPERVREPKTSDKHPRDEADRGASTRSRRTSRKR